jgi:hypothetical protein
MVHLCGRGHHRGAHERRLPHGSRGTSSPERRGRARRPHGSARDRARRKAVPRIRGASFEDALRGEATCTRRSGSSNGPAAPLGRRQLAELFGERAPRSTAPRGRSTSGAGPSACSRSCPPPKSRGSRLYARRERGARGPRRAPPEYWLFAVARSLGATKTACWWCRALHPAVEQRGYERPQSLLHECCRSRFTNS